MNGNEQLVQAMVDEQMESFDAGVKAALLSVREAIVKLRSLGANDATIVEVLLTNDEWAEVIGE